MYEKLRKLNLKRKFSLRTALMASLTLALLVSATVFITVSASDDVTPSDVSPTSASASYRIGGHSRKVSPTDVSASDGIMGVNNVSPIDTCSDPETLGDPVITMTTEKAVGESIILGDSYFHIKGDNLYVDSGDGNPVDFLGDIKVKGKTIKIYGNNVTEFICGDNKITSLDISKCASLKILGLWNNYDYLKSFDLSNNTALVQIKLERCNIVSLDISKNTALKKLICLDTELTSLDVSKNTSLEELGCSGNHLTSLDVSNNTSLIELICGKNNLASLDVSKNTQLKHLYIGDNQLTSIDVSNNTSLIEFYCGNCNLSSLNVSKNTQLKLLDFTGNQLSSIDISNNPNLTGLCIGGNQFHFSEIMKLDSVNNFSVSNPTDYYYDDLNYVFNYASQIHSIPSTIKVGENIDLSSEYNVAGTASEFTWYDSNGNIVTPATANGGVFTFGEDAIGKTLTCKMTNAKLPGFYVKSEEVLEWDDNGNLTGNTITIEDDNRLTTTEVKVEAADPISSEDPVSSENNSDNNGNGHQTPYYDLPFEQGDDIDFITDVKYPEGTTIDVDGRVSNLHSVKGVHLTVGNIETNTKKTVLDAIKHYNETFDTETTDIALYDISLEDKNNVHVKVVAGEILVCLKYPDNLARQSEDYVFHLYHQKADGTIEEIPVTIRRNGIWFRATDFSPYVLYWHVKTVESAGTGESFALIIVMTVLCALSVAGAGYALYRRKKLTAE